MLILHIFRILIVKDIEKGQYSLCVIPEQQRLANSTVKHNRAFCVPNADRTDFLYGIC